jgi:predicted AAA+ superfamily ATPase
MIERTIKKKLLELKKQFPAIAIFGPRQSGKTTLAQTTFPDYTYINLEDFQEKEFATTDPKGFFERYLKNNHGIILDEIQKAPSLLSYIQINIDENPIPGRFILTGSQNILLNQHISQTLAGRVALLTLLPLSIEELKNANALPSSAMEAVFQGFYPRLYAKEPINVVVFAESYMRTYVERDARDIKHITSLMEFQKFMRLCAGRIGQLLNLSSLANESGLSLATVKSWLSVLEASYIIFFLQPYYENFNKRIVKMPKLYFYDTALACNLLRITSKDGVFDHYLRGSLFESMIVADLMKRRFHHCLPPNVYFWRDKIGNEIDCVLEENGKRIPVEIKASSTINSEMFQSLLHWCELTKTPSHEGQVIYAGKEEQKRTTGHVIPWTSI